jgi:hypothetical protein
LSSLSKVNQAINKALLNPDVQRQLAGADELAALTKADYEKLTSVVKSLRHDGHSNRSSSPAKAGDPVFRDVSDGIEKPQRTGYPACAGYDESLGEAEPGTSPRHCEEPTGRANARPMTGSATKQSSFSFSKRGLLCFARNDDPNDPAVAVLTS